MQKQSDSAAIKQYRQGYAFGTNPIFLECEDLNKCAKGFDTDSFRSGFCAGRERYEQLNGKLEDGIPRKILTDVLLEKVTLSGYLNRAFSRSGYTPHQLRILKVAHSEGSAIFNADWEMKVDGLLLQIGILPSVK